MEEIVKEMGFDSLEEYHSMVSNFPMSSQLAFDSFEQWKRDDGTKKGLEEITRIFTS